MTKQKLLFTLSSSEGKKILDRFLRYQLNKENYKEFIYLSKKSEHEKKQRS